MKSVIALGLVMLLAGCITAPESNPDKHFQLMMTWLAGRWDNSAQVEAERRSATPAFDRHLHYAMHYVPIRTPAMDGQVFAIKSYNEGGFAGPLTRVALHRFRRLPNSSDIGHEFLFLLDPDRFGDLKVSLRALESLKESDVRINSQCRMYWRWQGDHFEGRTRQGQCITSSYTPTKILVEGHGILHAEQLIRHDTNYEMSGELRPRQGGSSPELFMKQAPQ